MVRVPHRVGAGRPPPSLRERADYAWFDSEVLKDNVMGDPSRRLIATYLPPSGMTEGKPLLVHLSGYTGTGWAEMQGERPWQESIFQVFDRMVRTRQCPEAVVVSPDAFTALGGSQYVNSEATGRYADYVVQEIVPWAQERFRTSATGVIGQSSGGFGAIHLASEFPGTFSAVGSSAGDMAFEYCYLPEFPRAVRALERHGGPEKFLREFLKNPSSVPGPADPSAPALELLAMASCYSPSPSGDGSFDLPIDLETGAPVPEVWRRWLGFDPVRRLSHPTTVRSLQRLRLLQVTASTSDEFNLDLGARWYVREARRRGLRIRHEEFDGGHFDRTPRFEAIFRSVTRALHRHSRR